MNIPDTFLREKQILGDKKSSPPIPAIIPISHTAGWEGIKQGRYPKPIKLSPRCTCWRASDIRALIESAGNSQSTNHNNGSGS